MDWIDAIKHLLINSEVRFEDRLWIGSNVVRMRSSHQRAPQPELTRWIRRSWARKTDDLAAWNGPSFEHRGGFLLHKMSSMIGHDKFLSIVETAFYSLSIYVHFVLEPSSERFGIPLSIP